MTLLQIIALIGMVDALGILFLVLKHLDRRRAQEREAERLDAAHNKIT